MSLDAANFVMEGPATVAFKASSTAVLTLTSLENENVKVTGTENINEKTRADGSKSYSRGGKELVVSAVFDELDPADLDAIESADSLTIAFANTGKTVTIATVDFAHAAIGDGRTTVETKTSKPVNTTWASMLSVA